MSRFNTHILIVEDEMTIAMDIEMRLRKMGYIVDGIAVDAAEAVKMVDEFDPDLLLMDIQLGESMNGISLSKEFSTKGFPVVFLTAFSDPGTFAQALDAQPHGYVLKPFRDDDLQRTIEIALQKSESEKSKEPGISAAAPDAFFIRDKGELLRVHQDEILWMEALDNYTRIHTAGRIYTAKTFLRDVLKKLPESNFVRVHRSFIVQVGKISRIEETTLYIDKQGIPIGRQYREELMLRLKIL